MQKNLSFIKSVLLGLVSGFVLFVPAKALSQDFDKIEAKVADHHFGEQSLTQELPVESNFISDRFPILLNTQKIDFGHRYAQLSDDVAQKNLPPYKKPLPSMAMSAILPGSAQIVHKKWVRAGVYAAIEIAGLVQNRHHSRKAQRLEQQYYDFVDQNWSVVKYANWLIGYNQFYDTNQALLNVWRPGAQQSPTYSNIDDWAQVNLEQLRVLERNTIYLTTLPGGTIQRDLAFSHVVPDYGSQQYYELASKYFQFAPGWRDFGVANTTDQIGALSWNYETISMLSPMWLDGSLQADRFNNHFRYASNWVSLLLINHIISAFDGYFTAKLAGYRLSLEAPMAQNELVRFRMDL